MQRGEVGHLVIAGEDNTDAVTAAVTELAPHAVPVEIDEAGLICNPDQVEPD